MKIGEIISRVQSAYSAGIASDDIRLSSQLVFNKMLSVRSKLMTQSLNKKQAMGQWLYETLPCVEMIEVPIHQCPCLPVGNCMILRSKHKIPSPLTGLSNDMIRSVNTIDFSHKIDAITLNAYQAQRGAKYTSKKMNYFVQDEYLYISTPTKIKVVMVTGMFEDVLAVEKFKGLCDCQDCVDCLDYKEIEFPIGLDQVDTMVELISAELVVLYKQISPDNLNNSIEDTQSK